MNKIYSLFSIVLLMACTQNTVLEKDNFYCPPKDNYPQTWFHFIGSNVSLDGITADLEAARKAGAEVSVVFLCWGKAESDKTTDAQKALAQQLADAGADIILGSHSGVLQPVQMLSANRGDGKYHPVLCAYSLGNLFSHDRTYRTSLASILLKTEVVYDAVSGCVAFDGLNWTPMYAWRGTDEGKTRQRILVNDPGALPSFVDAKQQGVMERCTTLVNDVMSSTGIEKAP